MAQSEQQLYQEETRQGEERQRSGGGGGGHGRKGGPDGLGPEELEEIFKQIGRAVGLFLSDESSMLLDEAATRTMLLTITDNLALYARAKRLHEFTAHLEHEAGNFRDEMRPTLSRHTPRRGEMRVLDQDAAQMLSRRIKDRYNPPVPGEE